MSNLEFVTKARKLLTEDYNAKHTAEYNSWLEEHKNSWMKPHFVVPFPPFIITSAFAPFKATAAAPSEDDIAAKALELYTQANPVVEKTTESAETVIEETVVSEVAQDQEVVPEPVVEVVPEPVVEVVPEPVVVATEPVVVEATVVEAPNYANEIYKIFQTSPPAISSEPAVPYPTTPDPANVAVEEVLNVVPQPVEELAKVKKSGKILPSVLQKLQDMKSKWTTKD